MLFHRYINLKFKTDVKKERSLNKNRVKHNFFHENVFKQSYNEETTIMNPRFAPVGDGTMNFPKIVAKMRELGVKYYFVEQDDAVGYPDPFGQVERSIRYIKGNL